MRVLLCISKWIFYMFNKNKQYLVAAIVYIIAYVYAIIIAPKISVYAGDSWIENKHRECIIKNDTLAPIIAAGRGDNYYIGVENNPQELSNCTVTFWGSTHFFLYFILGSMTNLFWETFTIGVGFELYEYYEFGCHDVFDIVLNTCGFLTGQAVRRVCGF